MLPRGDAGFGKVLQLRLLDGRAALAVASPLFCLRWRLSLLPQAEPDEEVA
jgi:hypothetical protein